MKGTNRKRKTVGLAILPTKKKTNKTQKKPHLMKH